MSSRAQEHASASAVEQTDRSIAADHAQAPRFDAFISYSHAADRRLATAIQAGLHGFAKPWYRLRALRAPRVFRDDATLATTPALWPAIQTGLDQSRFLVLFASPEAARALDDVRKVKRDPVGGVGAAQSGEVAIEGAAECIDAPGEKLGNEMFVKARVERIHGVVEAERTGGRRRCAVAVRSARWRGSDDTV